MSGGMLPEDASEIGHLRHLKAKPRTNGRLDRCKFVGRKSSQCSNELDRRNGHKILSIEGAGTKKPADCWDLKTRCAGAGRMWHKGHQGAIGIRDGNANNQTGAYLRRYSEIDQPNLAATSLRHGPPRRGPVGETLPPRRRLVPRPKAAGCQCLACVAAIRTTILACLALLIAQRSTVSPEPALSSSSLPVSSILTLSAAACQPVPT